MNLSLTCSLSSAQQLARDIFETFPRYFQRSYCVRWFRNSKEVFFLNFQRFSLHFQKSYFFLVLSVSTPVSKLLWKNFLENFLSLFVNWKHRYCFGMYFLNIFQSKEVSEEVLRMCIIFKYLSGMFQKCAFFSGTRSCPKIVSRSLDNLATAQLFLWD